jgi:hypothetical protein
MRVVLHEFASNHALCLHQAQATKDAKVLPIYSVCQHSDNPLETFYAPGS